MYANRTSLTAAPITRRIRQIPTEVVVGPDEGLTSQSVANLDNILTIGKSELDRYVGALSPARMLEVEHAIHFALGLSY